MYQLHPNQLWIGNALEIRDVQALFAADIAAVVDLAYEEPPAQLPREFIYCRFPLNDGGGNAPAVLRLAVQTIVELLSSATSTVVACSASRSRSPALAAAALAIYLDQPMEKVLVEIGQTKTLEISRPLLNHVQAILLEVRRAQ